MGCSSSISSSSSKQCMIHNLKIDMVRAHLPVACGHILHSVVPLFDVLGISCSFLAC